jgi:hypothetical protein
MGWIGKLFAKRADKHLADDIRNNLVLLFVDHAAQVAPNDESEYRDPRQFDFAVAAIVTGQLHFRFVRVRGEFSVYIAVPGVPRKWESLDSALTWLETKQGIRTPDFPICGHGAKLDWEAIDHFLAGNWDLIQAAANLSP